MNVNEFLWIAMFVVFIVIEAACPIHLVSIWFAIGAVAAEIASLLGANLTLQIIIFFVVSVVSLILFFPFVKKMMRTEATKTNIDALHGEKCYVIADIDNICSKGQVKINGMEWTARSTNGENIPAGTLVSIDKVEGVKLFVSIVQTKQTNQTGGT